MLNTGETGETALPITYSLQYVGLIATALLVSSCTSGLVVAVLVQTASRPSSQHVSFDELKCCSQYLMKVLAVEHKLYNEYSHLQYHQLQQQQQVIEEQNLQQ
jgi:hypothetical protein